MAENSMADTAPEAPIERGLRGEQQCPRGLRIEAQRQVERGVVGQTVGGA